jgi:glycerol uptake facilitator-like aquaporin
MRPPRERTPHPGTSWWAYLVPAGVVALATGLALALPSVIESCPPSYEPGVPCFTADERVPLRVAIVLLGILIACAFIAAGKASPDEVNPMRSWAPRFGHSAAPTPQRGPTWGDLGPFSWTPCSGSRWVAPFADTRPRHERSALPTPSAMRL